ncbi:MAG: RNHCP domain-containing protein [Candidatus Abawacabacteria bacterium]|nr:RNHCP domain-containing protein [Candidatus Abawacabacteria bacterium]
MKMTHRDEAFVCQNCHNPVAKRGGGYCRNHCPICLHSLHVDLQVPGDRQSTCQGIMVPVDVIYNTHKTVFQIIHQCQTCKYKHAVSIAKDDNQELVLKVTRASAERKMMDI